MDLVSIIVPIYNVEEYLHECVDSVLNQSYKEIEVILVDDGSPDGCGKICDEYEKKDARVKVIHKKNGGLSDARNAGLEAASGKYIYFLDSDDYLVNNAIEILVEFIRSADADMVNFEAESFCDDQPELLTDEKKNYYRKKNCYTEVLSGTELLIRLINNNDYRTPVQYYLFKADFIKRNGLRFHKGIIHEDHEFTFFAFLAAKKVMCIPMMLYYHRLRSDSIMGTKISQKNIDSFFAVINSCVDKYDSYAHDEQSREAFVCVLSLIVSGYIYNIKASEDGKSAKSIKDYNEIRNRIMNTSGLERIQEIVNLNSPSAIRKVKSLVRKVLSKLRFAKKIYNSYLEKKQDIDAECKEVIRQLADTSKDNNRIVVICVHHYHSNRGDLAISLAQKELLKRRYDDRTIIEVPTILCEKYSSLIRKYINDSDVIMISGGGWFGSLWRHNEEAAKNIIRGHEKNKVIIFPQSIYYNNDDVGKKQFTEDKKFFSGFCDLNVCIRDTNSYKMVLNNALFPESAEILFIPDIVLSYRYNNNKIRNNIVSLCIRGDIESELSDCKRNELILNIIKNKNNVRFISSNQLDSLVPMSGRKKAVEDFIDEITCSKLLVTDRLHCMIFAALSSTPCVALNNKTRKVEGVYSWINNLGYIKIIDDINQLDNAIDEVCSAGGKWDADKFGSHYDAVYSLIDK